MLQFSCFCVSVKRFSLTVWLYWNIKLNPERFQMSGFNECTEQPYYELCPFTAIVNFSLQAVRRKSKLRSLDGQNHGNKKHNEYYVM